MNDTVQKLTELADEYAVLRANWDSGHTSQTTPHLVDKARQALQDELTRLFTPLTDEQCEAIYSALDRFGREINEHDYGLPRDRNLIPLSFDIIRKAHSIT